MADFPALDPTAIRGNQITRFPHVLGDVNGHKVRYRVAIDSSYIEQSSAVVDVWSPATMSWNELWTLEMGTEFSIGKGPKAAKDVEDRGSRVLASVHNPNGPKYIADSWQKVITVLYLKAHAVLR